MLTRETVAPDPFDAGASPESRWRSLVEPWTDECPDPDHWLDTAGSVHARCQVEEALRSGPDVILVSAPTGYGKTMLLRSLRSAPPSGFMPVLVPFSNVEPDEIARWIVAHGIGSAGGDPAVELTSLLHANAGSGGKTLLLMDEVQSTAPATLAKLFELLDRSGVAVSVVLSGLPGDGLDRVLEAAPPSIQKIELLEPWSRFDAELLLTNVGLALGVPAIELIEAIDVDAAIEASAGNPRLVRAALERQLQIAERARIRVISAAAEPSSVASVQAPREHSCVTHDSRHPVRSVEEPTSGRTCSPVPGAGPSPSLLHRFLAPSVLRRTFHRRAEVLGRAAHGVEVVLVRRARSIRRGGLRAGREARARVLAERDRIRSLSIRLAAFAQAESRLWTRRLEIDVAAAGRRLSRRAQTIAKAARQLIHRGRRAPHFRVACGLAMAAAFVALGAATVERRVRIRSIGPPVSSVRANDVEPILFRLNSHPWAIVEVDGVKVGSTPLTIALEPGSHRFRVEMADGQIREEDLVVSTRLNHHAFRSESVPIPASARIYFASGSP